MKSGITLPTLVILVFVLVPTLVQAEFFIPSGSNDSFYNPAVDGNIVVWCNDYSDIYGYDINTATEFPICTNPAGASSPAISGNIVVWQDYRNGNYDIYGYNLNTATEFPICTDDTADQYSPKISGNIVVWQDYRNGNGDIYGYNLDTATEFPICTNPSSQESPAISGNIVVWQDYRNGNSDIYGYNIDTSTEFPICTQSDDQYSPAISGNIVVWNDYRNGNYDIYGYNLSTSTEFPICTEPGDQDNPVIGGDTVIWLDYQSGNCSLHFYNLQNTQSQHFPVSEYPYLATDGNFVVWPYTGYDTPADERGIWGLRLNSPDECLWPEVVSKGVPYYGSTAGMTGTTVSSCAYNDVKDIWHSFTPTASGDYTISLCGSSFDTTLSVFDGCKGAEIACNDDSCGYQSLLTFKAKAGKTYLIRVAGYDEDVGNYVLNLTGPAECVNRPSADLNGDCKVDFQDMAVLASQWLNCGLDDPNACWQ
jgi:beta propeller repeat protein